jgi:cell division protein ZipA
MDSTLLRMILLALGILVLVGMYFWETKRRNRRLPQARKRETPELGDLPQESAAKEDSGWRYRDDEPDNMDAELARLNQKVHEASDEVMTEAPLQATDDAVGEQQELFGFSANEASPLDVPSKIIQINLLARQGDRFNGPAILAAGKELGLKPGDMQIFHRYTSDGRNKTLFNMASLVEPGVFPFKAMDGFSTPGLTLFCQLPGPGDSLAIFADMLFTAQRLSATLGGELQDETHSALTKQTIEHIRSQILEHRRLVQLARSRR